MLDKILFVIIRVVTGTLSASITHANRNYGTDGKCEKGGTRYFSTIYLSFPVPQEAQLLIDPFVRGFQALKLIAVSWGNIDGSG